MSAEIFRESLLLNLGGSGGRWCLIANHRNVLSIDFRPLEALSRDDPVDEAAKLLATGRRGFHGSEVGRTLGFALAKGLIRGLTRCPNPTS